jgi:hypothetical protein
VCLSLAIFEVGEGKSKLVKSYGLSPQTPQRYGEILIAVCLLNVLSQTKNISWSVPQRVQMQF